MFMTATVSTPAGYTVVWTGPRNYSSVGAVLDLRFTLSADMNGDVYVAHAYSTTGCTLQHTVPISVTGVAQVITTGTLPPRPFV